MTYGPEQIDEIWPQVSGFIERAVALSDDVEMDWVKRLLLEGKFQLWGAMTPEGVIEGAWVTRIADYRTGRICEVAFAGGDAIERWMPDLFEPVKWWAKGEGCRAVRIVGRKGWQRFLPGFKEVSRTIEVEL